MEYRILGKTGLNISRLGFGGIPIQKIDAEGTKKLMGELLRDNVNFIDTARGYTVSEEYLGYALEGIRDRFVLATKSMARTKEAMARDIDISLNHLRTDYIDLDQVHNPSAKDLEQVMAPDGALEALLEAKASGKIGHIGITLHSVELFRQAARMGEPLGAEMIADMCADGDGVKKDWWLSRKWRRYARSIEYRRKDKKTTLIELVD